MIGRSEQRYVHELISLAFLGPRPSPKAEIRHLNGDPSDNRPENLSYGSRSRNTQDRKWHRPRAGALRPEEVCGIKQRLAAGISPRVVALALGVSVSTISAIQRGRTHKDVTDEDCLDRFFILIQPE
jgi:hypothetical protein